jgi:hypothetical protein
MKISEIAIPKKVHSAVTSVYNNPDTVYGLEAALDEKMRSLGWGKMGAGVYSTAYGRNDKSYIIKANFYPDPAFDDFVQLTHKFKNKHFPKISDRKEIVVHGDKYYIYTIEKLNPINQYTRNKTCVLIDRYIIVHQYTSYRPKDNFATEYPDLKKALDIIIKNKKDHHIDLHAGNLMQRKDGTVVIIDPYS